MTRKLKSFVTVVVPIYNAERTLAETLQSVCNQNCDFRYDIILIDDASKDNSLVVAGEFIKKYDNIEIITLSSSSGAAAARNAGLDYATSKYVAFCDSDDVWHPNKLNEQFKFMIENSLAISHTAYCKFEGSAKNVNWERRIVVPPPKTNYKTLLKGNVIGCSTVMLDAEKIGSLRFPDFKLRQDFAFWLDILHSGHMAKSLPKPLVAYRVGNTTLSSNKMVAARYHWLVLSSRNDLGFVAKSLYFMHYFCRAMLKFIK